MAPTILVIGATGNTGKSVVRTLSGLVEAKICPYRIVGLSRSTSSPAARTLAGLPHVEMQAKDWTEINTAWLKERHIVRAYIAPHNMPQQFAEESELHLALLNAGVKYVVRVSTNVTYMTPNNPVYYGRTHWAIENMLSQPEFEALQWTSLQPNFFTISYLAPAVQWIKETIKTGTAEPLPLTPAIDVPVAMVDPEDVGKIGAHLLVLEDVTPHNHSRYVLSGPHDVTGAQIVEEAEKHARVKAEEVSFKATAWLAGVGIPEKLLPSVLAGFEPLWEGKCSLAKTPTSQPIVDLGLAPRRTMSEALEAMLED